MDISERNKSASFIGAITHLARRRAPAHSRGASRRSRSALDHQESRAHGYARSDKSDPVMEQFKEIVSTATSSIVEVRSIAHNLRPYELDRLGLVAAIESMIDRVSASTSIEISGDLDPIEGLLSPEAETSVYRIIQEGLNNVVKHSYATKAVIRIKKSFSSLTISVNDNGRGISRRAPSNNGHSPGGFGLAGIAERVRLLGLFEH